MTTQKSTRKTRLIFTTALFAALLATAAVTTVACGRHGEMSPKMMHRMVLGAVDDLMDDVEATPAQRAAFESAAENITKEAIALKQQHQKHEKQMLKMLGAENLNRPAIKAHVEENLDTLEDVLLAGFDQFLDAYETLDPGQRQIVIQKLAKHMHKH